MQTRSHLVITLAGGLLAVACSGEQPAPAAAPTYHGDVRAIVEARCLGCHQAGGVAPFALDDYAALKTFSQAALTAIEAGTMPPWMPDPDCRRYQDERLMPELEKALFRAWVEAGAPEGDPADYVAPAANRSALTLEELGPPDLELAYEEAYAPDPSRPDDYRCFPLSARFDEETFVRTSNVVPGEEALVHHVILYLVAPQYADLVDGLDADDPGPGYGCFGGVGVGSPTPIAGWTPGDAPLTGAEDAAIRVPAGARLVVQMHYNTLAADPAPDRTGVQLWLLDEQPEFLITPTFFPHLGIDIQPGDPESHHERRFRNNSSRPWTIVGTSPHMHLLGKRLRTSIVHADGEESCLVDVPRWDFDWQQSYLLPDGEALTVEPGEAVRLECTYDNSAANQPVVNGERREPERVGWGEGTLDEMCLNTMIMLEPYAPLPEPGDRCQDFQGCYDQCKTSPFPLTGCILRCGASDGCASCVLPGLFSATSDQCGVQGGALIECIDRCGAEEDQAACITDQCGVLVVGYDVCARPLIEAGVADRTAMACGVEL